MMKKFTIKKLKAITIVTVMFLSFYPVFELSRCIILYSIINHWPAGLEGAYPVTFYLELFLIWMSYLALPLAINEAINTAVRITNRNKG